MFTVNKETKENTLKYFQINKLSDFVQEDCFVQDLVIDDGAYGKQLKITIGKDDASTYAWVCSEPGEDKEINGKMVTKDMQIATVVKVVAHIGRKFLGETFEASGKTFDELCNDLIAQTKDKWANTPLKVKFLLKDGKFANLQPYVPFLENMSVPSDKSKLYASKKDIKAFNEAIGATPDIEDSEATDSTAPEDMF